MTDSMKSTKELAPELLDVIAVAELCGCSTRTIRRLADAGRMPTPIRLAGLVRWRRSELLRWLDAGCPPRDRWEQKKAAGR